MAYIRNILIRNVCNIYRQSHGYCSFSFLCESTVTMPNGLNIKHIQGEDCQRMSESQLELNGYFKRPSQLTKVLIKTLNSDHDFYTRLLSLPNRNIFSTKSRCIKHLKTNYQRYSTVRMFYTDCFKHKLLEKHKHNFIQYYSNDSGNNSDSESEDVKIVLSVVGPKPTTEHVNIVPGKGPPPEPPVDCCMSGCANCVWIQYAEELKEYFTGELGLQKAKEAIEEIDNPGLKMFLKLELNLL